MNWYVSAGGGPIGPLPEDRVVALIRGGMRLVAVYREGGREWVDPRSCPPFAAAVSGAPIATPQPVDAESVPPAAQVEPVAPPRRDAPSPRNAPLPKVAKFWGWIGGSMGLVGGLVWWAITQGNVATAEQSRPKPIEGNAPVAMAAASPASEPIPACDIEKLWSADDSAPGQRRAKVMLAVEGWTPDCRFHALQGVCINGCDGLLADLIVGAAPKTERPALAKLRAQKNRDVALRGRALYGEVDKLGHYAISIMSSPRSSIYRKSHPAEPQAASSTVKDDGCVERMKSDLGRVKEIRDKLEAPGPLPVAGFWMKEALSATESCLDCKDDRSPCRDILRFLTGADDELRSYERKIEADAKLAGAPPARGDDKR
jgi:hypothetical protein